MLQGLENQSLWQKFNSLSKFSNTKGRHFKLCFDNFSKLLKGEFYLIVNFLNFVLKLLSWMYIVCLTIGTHALYLLLRALHPGLLGSERYRKNPASLNISSPLPPTITAFASPSLILVKKNFVIRQQQILCE